jgi:hypothetical protein
MHGIGNGHAWDRGQAEGRIGAGKGSRPRTPTATALGKEIKPTAFSVLAPPLRILDLLPRE